MQAEIDRPDLGTRGMSVETIVNGLKPEHDEVDRRILFELTGIKLDGDDGSGSSSFEDYEHEQVTDGVNAVLLDNNRTSPYDFSI